MSAGFVVRRASVEDAVGIGRVHVASRRETYAPLVEPGELDEVSVDAKVDHWRQVIDDDQSRTWVAVVGDEIVGFSRSGTRRNHERVRPLELEAIYLLAAHHGSGAGQELLESAVGDAPAFLFVADGNPRAWSFYRRNGFEFDGATETFPLVRTPLRTLRMVR